MKKLLGLLVGLLLTFTTLAQSGWQSGNYYSYRGQTVKDCGYTYAGNISYYDGFGNPHYYIFRNCQILSWRQEYYSGYIYYWGPSGWYTQYQQGTFWYCWFENITESLGTN